MNNLTDWDEMVLRIADAWKANWMKTDYEVFMSSLASLPIKMDCLVQLYGTLVKHKKIPSIKEMDEEEKEAIKQEVLRIAIDKQDWMEGEKQIYLNKLFKSIYAFGQYVQL